MQELIFYYPKLQEPIEANAISIAIKKAVINPTVIHPNNFPIFAFLLAGSFFLVLCPITMATIAEAIAGIMK